MESEVIDLYAHIERKRREVPVKRGDGFMRCCREIIEEVECGNMPPETALGIIGGILTLYDY